MRQPPTQALLDELLQIVPPEALLFDEEDLHPYECDGLSAYRRLPLLVVLPTQIEQVQQIMWVAFTQKIPVIARGAGTGLSGGALPFEQAIVLSLARFNSILELDPIARTARVQPGVRNLAISDAAKPHELYYAPDPSSQIACTIGGNVAENSGGVHCLKYGLTVHNLLALTIVTVQGKLIQIGTGALDAPGYDLLALLTGSEGMLGIIVEVTVKLLPIPESTQLLLAAFDSVEQAGDAVRGIIGSGIIPAGLEMMDALSIRAAEAFAKAGYPTDAQAILLCELDGFEPSVAEEVRLVQQLLDTSGATLVRIAQSYQERAQLWKGRKSAFPAIGRLAPDYYCMDGTIPRKNLPQVLKGIQQLSDEFGLLVANVFHAGDGNLHPLILYDANNPGELAKAEDFGGKILELCVQQGGSITGEHGVGMEKLNQMCVQFGKAELEQFHRIKAAFDIDHLLNPGKAIPSLHRCAELGRMHIHQGELPHPDLPRF